MCMTVEMFFQERVLNPLDDAVYFSADSDTWSFWVQAEGIVGAVNLLIFLLSWARYLHVCSARYPSKVSSNFSSVLLY